MLCSPLFAGVGGLADDGSNPYQSLSESDEEVSIGVEGNPRQSRQSAPEAMSQPGGKPV